MVLLSLPYLVLIDLLDLLPSDFRLRRTILRRSEKAGPSCQARCYLAPGRTRKHSTQAVIARLRPFKEP